MGCWSCMIDRPRRLSKKARSRRRGGRDRDGRAGRALPGTLGGAGLLMVRYVCGACVCAVAQADQVRSSGPLVCQFGKSPHFSFWSVTMSKSAPRWLLFRRCARSLPVVVKRLARTGCERKLSTVAGLVTMLWRRPSGQRRALMLACELGRVIPERYRVKTRSPPHLWQAMRPRVRAWISVSRQLCG